LTFFGWQQANKKVKKGGWSIQSKEYRGVNNLGYDPSKFYVILKYSRRSLLNIFLDDMLENISFFEKKMAITLPSKNTNTDGTGKDTKALF